MVKMAIAASSCSACWGQQVGQERVRLVVELGRAVDADGVNSRCDHDDNWCRRDPFVLPSRMDVGVDDAVENRGCLHPGSTHENQFGTESLG